MRCRPLAAAAALLLWSASSLVTAAELPEDCSGFIVTQRLDGCVRMLSTLLKGWQPEMKKRKAYVEAWLGRRIRNPELLGVDRKGAAGAFWVREPDGGAEWVHTVAVKDARLFLGAAGRGLKALGEREGCQVFQQRVFDREAYRRAGAAQRLDMDRFFRMRRVCVGFAGKLAVCGSSTASCAKVIRWVKAGGALRPALSGAVGGVFRAAELARSTGAEERRRREALLQSLHAFVFLGAADSSEIGATFRVMCESALDLAAQTRNVQFGADLHPIRGLRVRLSVAPEPGSAFARFLRSQKPGGRKLAGMLPAELIGCAAMDFRLTPELMSAWADLMGRISEAHGSRPLTPDERARLRRSLIDTYRLSYRGPMAVGWVEPAGLSSSLQLIEVFEVADPRAAQAAWEGTLDEASPMRRVYAEMGLNSGYSMTPLPSETAPGGVRVLGTRVELDREEFPIQSIHFVNRLFGGRIEARFAVVGGFARVSAGGDSLKLMRRLLAVRTDPKLSFARSTRYRVATRGVKGDWNFLVYFSPSRMHEWFVGLVSLTPGIAVRSLTPKLARREKVRGPGVSVVGVARDGRIEVTALAPSFEVFSALRGLARARQAMAGFRVDRLRPTGGKKARTDGR